MAVKIASGLPKDSAENGLVTVTQRAMEHPLNRHLVLAVLDCSKIARDPHTGETDVTMRVRRLEPVAPMDVVEGERLVRRALEFRSGESVLPIDLEISLDQWFGRNYEVDRETGEIRILDNADEDSESSSAASAPSADTSQDVDDGDDTGTPSQV